MSHNSSDNSANPLLSSNGHQATQQTPGNTPEMMVSDSLSTRVNRSPNSGEKKVIDAIT